MRYIALLRGVNVGGNNKLSMPELRAAFAEHGFSDVASYINSGNILFSSGCADAARLRAECEALIRERFSMDISVAVLSADELKDALDHAPDWWNSDADSKHNAIFVIAPATAAEVCAQAGEIKPEYEKLDHYGKLIFWSAPLKTFSMTRWSKIVGTAAYRNVTIRNANTALKLASLVQTE